jgi:hypothetical protein
MAATPTESAQLILRLYELRRETVLRQARAWFAAEFNPTTWEELGQRIAGEPNAWFRMVVSYWDMAASLVSFGAIDPAMFHASNGELVVVFAKLEPFLAQLREQRSNPEFLRHMEQVVGQLPGAVERLPQIREQFRAMAQAAGSAGVAAGNRR